MNILLINSPFCTPVTPPYSITGIYAFLKANINSKDIVECIDLNAIFHKKKFIDYYDYFQHFTKNYNEQQYKEHAKAFRQESSKIYKENNKLIRENKNPELFNELIKLILDKKPNYCAFSLVYSSQIFYTYKLIKELKKHHIKIIIGGPAVNQKLIDISDEYLKNEIELFEFLTKTKTLDNPDIKYSNVLDFSIYDKSNYLTTDLIIPIKTSSTCYYQQCAFCTHHQGAKYFEFNLKTIEESIKKSNANFVFLIDDMIHKKRLINISRIMKKYKVNYICQLKPTIDLDEITLKKLYKSGLKVIMWGIESGNNRVLNAIRKGTNVSDISTVLNNSKKAKITNVVYMMAGFPSETKDELLDTINFLKDNQKNIDLVSMSIFGLQKGSPIYNNPKEFGITKINIKKRTLLDDSLTYEVSKGLSQNDAKSIIRKYKKTIEKINKFPKQMNFFREHMLIIASQKNN